MSFKPIEPGCTCLSISPSYPGECIANFFIPSGSDTPCGKFTTNLPGWDVTFTSGDIPRAWVRSSRLMRIDGGEDETLTVEEEQEVSA